MARVKVAAFSVSIDGFGAGPRQDLENPLGLRGMELHGWFFPTETFQQMQGDGGGGTRGVDNEFALRSFENAGAWILGRNMFGPVRGAWEDNSWRGWWGDNPPHHTPVFVLTHHRRAPLVMEGGTTFYFVTDGAESALERAKDAAKGKDVRVGGGVSVVRQYLKAGQVDEMHLAVSPLLLREGENLFAGMDLAKLGYAAVKAVPGETATHVLIERKLS
jgi:dihydrofolate reductase